jgi:ribosome maturation factor RimP
MPRQYKKNIGRTLEVTLLDDNIVEGKLESIDPDGIVLFIKENKKKKIAAESKKLLFNQIKESKVIISFK